jgi:hypothetical protein
MRAACLTALLVASAVSVFAQAPPAAPVTLAETLQRGYANIKMNLVQSVEKMPEADFGFKVGSMAETRTFAALFGHVANSQFGTCAAVKGVPNPNQGTNLEETARTKPDVLKALNASFAFCDDAFSSLTPANAMDMITQGRGQLTRAGALANLVAHSNEMYGTSAAYMRARGLVPPSTERQQAGRGAPAAPGGGRGRGQF